MLPFQDYIESPQWKELSTDQRRYVLEAWAEKYGVPKKVKEDLIPYTWKSTQGAKGIFPAIASGAFRGLTGGLFRLEDMAPKENIPYLRASQVAHPVATGLSDMAAFMVPATAMAKIGRAIGLGSLPTLGKVGTEAAAFTGLEAVDKGAHGEPVTIEDLAKSFAANALLVGAGRGLHSILDRGNRVLSPEEQSALKAPEPVPSPPTPEPVSPPIQAPVSAPITEPQVPKAPAGAFSWSDLAPGMADNEAIRLKNAAIREELARRFSEALPKQ